MNEIHQGHDKQEKEIEQLHKIFDAYRIRSQELNKVIRLFLASIFLMGGSYVLGIYWGDYILEWFNIQFKEIIIPLNVLSQLGILLSAIKCYAIDPDKMQDVHYLTNELDINPHSLINALDLTISYSNAKQFREMTKREDPLTISLNIGLRAYGFRFLYVITDEEGRIYYISFGPVTANMKGAWRSILTPTKYNKSGEYNRVDIGSFQFNLIKEEKKLNTILLVFLPFFENEKYHPMYSEGHYETSGIGEGYITSSTGGMWKIDSMNNYRNISYKGRGLKIKFLEFSGEEKESMDKVLKKVVQKFKHKILSIKKICQYSSLDGNLLETIE